jgi:hypothetical protein
MPVMLTPVLCLQISIKAWKADSLEGYFSSSPWQSSLGRSTVIITDDNHLQTSGLNPRPLSREDDCRAVVLNCFVFSIDPRLLSRVDDLLGSKRVIAATRRHFVASGVSRLRPWLQPFATSWLCQSAALLNRASLSTGM